MKRLALLLLAPLLALSCGSSGGGQDEGRVFLYRLASDPPSLDPIHATDTVSATIVFRLFEGLVRFDPETLEVEPALAESWEISPDGRTYTFRLRRGVTFHNGREVTAEDFRWSFERALTPANLSERSWLLDAVAGAPEMLAGTASTLAGFDAPDPYTVVLTLNRPYAPFIYSLCMDAGFAVARESVEGGEFVPIGTGPFRFMDWDHGIRVSLRAYENYHGEPAGIERVDYEVIPDVGVAFQKFAAGELDLVEEIPPGQLGLIREKFPDALHVWPFLRNEYIGFNQTRPPFKGNLKLRQALSWAVDREGIVNELYEGAAVAANSVLPPGMPGKDDTIPGYGFDLEKAAQLLAEAGYPNGDGLPELTLWYNNNEMHQQNVQYIQSTFKQIGVNVRLRSLDWPAYLKACESHEPDLYRLGWVADIPDPDNFLYTLLATDQIGPAGNYSGFSDPEFDRLVTEARSITDQSRRMALYRQADRLAMDQACWIMLMYASERILFNPAYEGLVLPRQGHYMIPLEKLRYRE